MLEELQNEIKIEKTKEQEEWNKTFELKLQKEKLLESRLNRAQKQAEEAKILVD